MFIIRPSNLRGHFDFGWLQTNYTFSFGDYYDPNYMGFRPLRVINQDIVKPHTGFSPHSHKEMEIITYVLQGAVTHQDSMGNETLINRGEIQLMSAGTGVRHSEYNRSNENLELLQIWIMPNKTDLKPSYQQTAFDKNASLQLLVSPNGAQGSLLIHQDIKLFRVMLKKDEQWRYEIANHRHLWLQIISGKIAIEDLQLNPGDGLAVSEEKLMALQALQSTEFLLFDLN